MAETSISGIEFSIVGTTTRARSSVDKLVTSLKGLKTALNSTRTAKLEKELEGIDKNAKKSTTTLGKLFKSVGRIGFYRAIRSALRFITEGFREGLQNAYQFSKVVGYDLAATMDNLATKSLTMKNQLGSAFGSLIMAVEPILLQLIALVTRAANALAQFFAAIGGKETYLKAIDTVTQYGEAVGGVGQAAKEAMRYLAPFDELNVLPAQNEPGGGGGGASTPDYSQMFEESPVMQKLADFGASLRLSFNDMFIDWDDLTPEQISEKIIGAILGLTGFLAGIAITGSLTGGLVVGIAGVATALVFNSVVFDHDGKIDKGELQSMLRLALIGITGGLIGFSIGGPGGALIGASIGLGLDAALEAINFFTDGKLEGAMEGLVRGISAGLGGVIGFMIGGPAGAVLGATIGLGISFGLENFVFGDTTGWSTGDWIRNIVATLAPVAGAAIGLVVGGPAGALIGATIGLGIQFALNADTTDGAESSGKTIGEKILEGIGKPFKAIGDWIKNHIIDPIKEKLQGFSISDLLGSGSGSGESETGVSLPVKLVKEGWSTVSGWVTSAKQFGENVVKKMVGLIQSDSWKNNGSTVSGWINKLFSGAKVVAKQVGLIQSDSWKKNGGTVLGWINKLFLGSGSVKKPVGIVQSDSWVKNGGTVLNWISKLFLGSGPVKKDVGIVQSSSWLNNGGTVLGWINKFFLGSGVVKKDVGIIQSESWKNNGGTVLGWITKFLLGSGPVKKDVGVIQSDSWISSGGTILDWINKWYLGNGVVKKDVGVIQSDNWVNNGGTLTSWIYNNFMGSWLGKDIGVYQSGWESIYQWITDYYMGDGVDKGISVSRDGWETIYKWIIDNNYLGDDITKDVIANYAWARDSLSASDKTIDVTARFTNTGIGGTALGGYNGGVIRGNRMIPITSYASGGTPPGGQIFRARENGNPELVGTLKGSTAIMNNNQIVASVSSGVARAISNIQFHMEGLPTMFSAPDSSEYDEEMMYRAMLRALNDSDVADSEITLDGDVLYRKMVQRNQMNTRMTGVNVMATA